MDADHPIPTDHARAASDALLPALADLLEAAVDLCASPDEPAAGQIGALSADAAQLSATLGVLARRSTS